MRGASVAFGEVGSLTRGNFGDGEVVRVDFTENLTSAVIHLSSTNQGGNEFSLRVVSVDETGFSFVLEEWEDEDGPHPATETINWIAVEPGVHELPDGRIIEAGTTTATDTASAVSLNGGFGGTPVVLTNVMSQNDTDVVDSDPSGVSAAGFNVSLQEGSLSDGTNTGETVGYIAIGTGGDGTSGYASISGGLNSGNSNFALDGGAGTGTLTNGAVFAETQSLNEAGSGNVVIGNADIAGSDGTITMKFDEETGNGEEAHGNETVGLVGFEIGLLLCFGADTLIETETGPHRCGDLQPGVRVLGADGSWKILRRVFQRQVTFQDMTDDPKLRPVRIAAGSLGQGLPHRDLLVSRQHRMLVASKIADRMFGGTEVLVPAIRLTVLPGIELVQPEDGIAFVHLLFDSHEVIIAEGAPSESLFTGPEALKAIPADSREEMWSLFPQLRHETYRPMPARHIPIRLRQKRLVERHARNGVAPLQLWTRPQGTA